MSTIRVQETACPLDCPDSCSLEVSVENGRVVTIDGSHRSPTTRGFICGKVRRFGERLYGPERLLHPLVRSGPRGSGEFRRVSWQEALGLVAHKMRAARAAWGGESILPYYYGGSNGPISQGTADFSLWDRIGASRLERTVCAAPTTTACRALYGRMPGVSYLDYPHARLVVVWGANPSATGIHLVPFIRKAKQQGASLIVVDPRATPLARQADLHIALRPGTDVVVALAIHRHLFAAGVADLAFLEEHASGYERLRERAEPWTFEAAAAVAGVDREALERFAHLYVSESPSVVRCGWGLERNRNGGAAAMAVLALPAVRGAFGVRGGGFTMSNSASWPIDRAVSLWRTNADAKVRSVNMNLLGRALTEYDDPPIKVLFVYNCNPAVTVPDQNRVLDGLAREDLFTVVFEQVMTDTAALADVVLPATTFLEAPDIAKAYGPLSLQRVDPVIAPVGEARPNVDVFAELAGLLDVSTEDAVETADRARERFFAALPDSLGSDLVEHGAARPPFDGRPIQFVDVFPETADGRIDLFPEALERESPAGLYAYQADPATERFPLTLISPATERMISSSLGEIYDHTARVDIHPADAVRRGIESGSRVRIFNDLGEVTVEARVSEIVRPGTLALAKGLWRRHTSNGKTSNAVVPDTLTDLGGGACFNDARVEIEPCPPE